MQIFKVVVMFGFIQFLFQPLPIKANDTAYTYTDDNKGLYKNMQRAKKEKFTSKKTGLLELSNDKITIPQRFLIKYKAITQQQKSRNLPPFTILKKYKALDNIQLIEVNSQMASKEIIKQFNNDPNIAYIEKDQEIYLRTIPNDARFDELWSMHNQENNFGFTDADINAVEAWDTETGSENIVLAVIDTGVDYNHEDLKDNIWINPNETPDNGIDDDNNGYVDDYYGIDPGQGDTDPMDPMGHGTHIAGIIAAKGDNETGISGVNWNAKILTCKIFGFSTYSIAGFTSSAIECLDYILDLKINKGIDIIASNNSWGWSGNDSQALKEAIQRNADAGILFVAAAGNDRNNNDTLNDFPSTYYLPNIISVAASNSYDNLSYFSSFGNSTVHVTAPGDAILSTLPGNQSDASHNENIFNDIFSDDVESGEGDWLSEGSWEIENNNTFDGGNVWSDNVATDYEPNQNASLISPTINLSEAEANLKLAFFAKHKLEGGFDNVFIEIYSADSDDWKTIGQISGESESWQYYTYSIPGNYRSAQFQFRFRLVTDEILNFEGISIDRIGIGTDLSANEDSTVSDRYDTRSGTSMAAPHVTGLLGLLKAQDNNRTMQQLRNLVIAGGTPLPVLADKTISGRRLRAWDTDGVGSLSCEEQTVLTRLRPASSNDSIFINRSQNNNSIDVAYLAINCGEPMVFSDGEKLLVSLSGQEETTELKDNGEGFDQIAGDGIFSASININDTEQDYLNIILPDESLLTVRLVDQYSFTESNKNLWREISNDGDSLSILDDIGSSIISPFPIRFADSSGEFDKIYVSDNGILVLFNEFEGAPFASVDFRNKELPTQFTQRIISPFWFDLYGPEGSIYWKVLGDAPNRELVIQWENMPAFGSRSGNNVSFQVVFFEDHNNIVFSYKDIEFGIPIIDNGSFSTVGIQLNSSVAKTYSYDTPSLSSGKSIIWHMDNEPMEIPVVVGESSNDNAWLGGLSITFLLSIFILYLIALFINQQFRGRIHNLKGPI